MTLKLRYETRHQNPIFILFVPPAMEDRVREMADSFARYSTGDDAALERVYICRCPTEITVEDDRKTKIIYMQKQGDEWERVNDRDKSTRVYKCFGCMKSFLERDRHKGIVAITRVSSRPRYLCPPCCRLFIAHLSQETVNQVLVDIKNAKVHRVEQENGTKRKLDDDEQENGKKRKLDEEGDEQ